jgi:formate dehydrogenase major subunit
MVMGIANLAMATGNIGREGVGVNPLRGQNNVQGSCDMGSFPHEFPGYRHVSDDDGAQAVRERLGRRAAGEPGLRIPNMFEAALDGEFKGLYIEGEDIAQSDPNTQHVTAALTAMECIIVQDLFLNESAKFAHVFLPGSSFLEKDGTFTNAERRISRVRKVMKPKSGYADWEITQLLANAVGYPMNYAIRRRSWMRSHALTPTFTGVSFARIDELGSIQWPCNAEHPRAHRPCTSGEFVRGKGKFLVTEYVPTSEKVNARYPADPDHRTHLEPVQCRRADAAHENNQWHDPRIGWKSIRTMPRSAASPRAIGSASRAAPATRCCAPASPSACSREWSTPPSISPNPAPTSSPPITPTGRPIVPSTRSPPCRPPASASPPSGRSASANSARLRRRC